MRRKKPTRNDLLAVIGSLQNIIGSVEGVATDRNPHRAAHIAALSKAGLQLCIDARDYDPPEAGEGSPWNVTVDLRGVA